MQQRLDVARAWLGRMETREGVRRAIFLLLLALISGVMLLLNVHTPLMMDDYDYSFSWSTGERIAGLADIVASQTAHYRLWGGRSVVHALAQLFLSMDKRVFDVANTLMYLLLLLELYALARPRGRRWCFMLLLAAHGVLFCGVPFFGTVFLWLTGACNYLWGTALALTPLLILRSALELGFFSKGKHWLLALPVCFLAGWTNENTACGVLALVLVILIGLRVQKKRVPGWLYMAALMQALGAAVMLLAPGNYARASDYGYDSLVLELLRRAVTVAGYTVVYMGALAAALVLLMGLSRELHVKGRTGRALLLLLGALLTAGALVASPVASDRSWTGAIALALAAVLVLLGDIEEQVRALDAAKLVALPLLCALLLTGGVQALSDVRAHETAWLSQVARVEAAAAAGEESVPAESVMSRSRFTMDVALSGDSALWPDATLSRAFGINVNGP